MEKRERDGEEIEMQERERYEEPLLTKHDALRGITAQSGSVKGHDKDTLNDKLGESILVN